MRYLRWCGEQSPAVAPLDKPVFWVQFAARCERVNIPRKERDGKVYCVGVKLAS
jgi:hypothetical protein